MTARVLSLFASLQVENTGALGRMRWERWGEPRRSQTTIFSVLCLTRRSGLAAFSCRTAPLHCLTGPSPQTRFFQFASPSPMGI